MTKKTKTAVAVAVAFDAVAVGKDIGVSLGQYQSGVALATKATEKINADIAALRKAKVKLGASRKTCDVAAAIYDAMPNDLATGTRNNYLSEIRKCVNDGKKFSFNAGRERAKAKAKTGAKANGGTIMLSFPSGVALDKAVTTLEKGVTKMKDSGNDALVRIAAYLVDCVEELKEQDTE